jgi:16S rRNA (cytosine967-C5)-methyltransferase
LVYSTCSIEPEENALLVRKISEDHPELKFIAEKQIVPGVENSDGAYAAVWHRA